MIVVACSGFPVPVSRYWREFRGIEVSDTELGIPGEGTVRRWIRERPKGFCFTLLAPKEIAESGFAQTDRNRELAVAVGELGQRLDARGIVFVGGEGFDAGRAKTAAVKGFLSFLPEAFPPIVMDLPAWKPDQVAQLARERPLAVAYDPLSGPTPPLGTFAYVRLPGPAGYRSRYDDAAVDQIAEHIKSLETETVFCVFRNIDMHPNARRLRELIS